MLSNPTGTSNLENVTLSYIDKDVCDIDGSDEEDTNNNELLPESGHSETNFGNTSDRRIAVQSVINGNSPKMTIPQSNDSLSARRPSTIGLKPIVTVNTISNDADVTDGCFGDKNSEHECSTGINIKFQDLIYRARREISWDRSTKTILNGVNGEFRAGELTAIMGPSGAGKSTLLDICAGYTTSLASGSITINGRSRDLKRFRNQAAYIMQDDQLQMHITVWEAMFFSVNLKIGSQLKRAAKKERIQEILEAIGLYENRYTKTGELSGGQRKRLAIALELVDNPQFMAFDEPTSGLDSSTSTQVVLLLKQLAQEGRTIVCSIHQPSALLFGMFDHLYAMAEGQCIYAGATGMLVPFLADVNLICPKSYNPSDFLLEISTHDYGSHNERLVAKMENGLNQKYRENTQGSAYNYSLEIAAKMIEGGLMTPVFAPELAPLLQSTSSSATPSSTTASTTQWKKPKIISLQLDSQKCCAGRTGTYATSFCRQWYLLTLRTILCLRRDRSLAMMRLIIHLCIALLVGTLYYNIGNKGALALDNFKYIVLTMMFLMFTAFCSMTIIFPLEMPVVAREHFNRWYSKKAYYCALTVADLPLQFCCVLMYVLITYLMTAQPLEMFRLGLFFIMAVMVTLIAQGFGMIVGAAFGVKLAVIVGPFVLAPFVVFAGLFLRLSDAPVGLHWLFHGSFMKYAIEGSSHALFGYNRPKLECTDMYCHFRYPLSIMQQFDMDHGNYLNAFVVLLVFCAVLRFVAFFIMALRLIKRW